MNHQRNIFTLKFLFLLNIFFFLLFFLSFSSFAEVPRYLNYQGKLLNKDGEALNGTYALTFRIYDSQSAGTAIWTERQSVSLESGFFNLVLGTATALNLDFDKEYWFTLQVGQDSEMSPRQRLTASAYALNSDKLDNLNSTQFLRSDTSTTAQGKITFTYADGTPIVITPAEAMDADTKMIDLQDTDGETKFSVDYEGDAVVAGDLDVTGTISGATAIDATTAQTFTIDSDKTGTEPADGAGLVIEGGTGDASITWDAARDSLKANRDFSIAGALAIREGGVSPVYYSTFTGADQSDNLTYILPANTGTNGQFLQTNGSGTLSWASTVISAHDIVSAHSASGLTSGNYLRATSPTAFAFQALQAGDLPASIDATKISDGTVDNTEFAYLNGVTSAIQTQLNAKAAASDLTTHTAAASAVHGLASGSYVAGTTDTQTFTNKTLFSPTLSGAPTAASATWANLGAVTTADINGGTIDGTTIGANSAAAGTFSSGKFDNIGVNTAVNSDYGIDISLSGAKRGANATVTLTGDAQAGNGYYATMNTGGGTANNTRVIVGSNNQITVDTNNSGEVIVWGFGVNGDATVSGAGAAGFGVQGGTTISGSEATGIGVKGASQANNVANNQTVAGGYFTAKGDSIGDTAIGVAIDDDEATVDNPTGDFIGFLIDWSIGSSDSNYKKWTIYNSGSTNASGGKIFLGGDNLKTYWGTGNDGTPDYNKDASICYDGTDLVVNPKELGSGDLKVSGKANATEGFKANGTLLIDSSGYIKPVSSTDAAAPNNSIYYSTTQSRLVYKDSSGTANALY